MSSDDGELVALRCSVAVFRHDTVLLCHRRPTAIWSLPGGTPRPGEGLAACARREVLEETGLAADPERVGLVLETTSPDVSRHLIEIVFVAVLRDQSSVPEQREEGLEPAFVDLDRLGSLHLLPPIGRYVRGLARSIDRAGAPTRFTAAYLGNVWRPT